MGGATAQERGLNALGVERGDTQSHQPLSAPKVKPPVMYFSRAMPAATTGMTLTSEIALMFHHSV